MSIIRTALRAVATALAMIVALVLGIYLVVNVVGVIAAQGTRERVSEQLTERLGEEVPDVQRRAAATTVRVDPEPVYTWVAQACRFDTDDAGWMVQNYRQVCDAEAGAAWSVTSEDAATTMVDDLLVADVPSYRSGSCVTLGMTGDVFGKHETFLYVAPGGDRGERYCVPGADGHPARRAVVRELPSLDPSQGWLLVLTTTPLVDEDLGCLHWTVLFCDNPFGDEYAWGEPAD
jgi:hypothetical protein